MAIKMMNDVKNLSGEVVNLRKENQNFAPQNILEQHSLNFELESAF